MTLNLTRMVFTLGLMSDTLEDAWDQLHEANVQNWYVGKPAFDERRNSWSLYPFDPTEKPKVGHRSREWTAVHPTQIGVIRGMARCLGEIAAGRVPK